MTTDTPAYRQRYLDRAIPLYDPHNCAPYPAGETPREGWYIIEVSGTSEMPDPIDPGTPDNPRTAVELLDEEAIQQLCDQYDPAVNGGHGPLANEDHLCLMSGSLPSRAMGWIQALDYSVTDSGQVRLAAYMRMTDEGYGLIQGGVYWAWSTEYLMSDYYSRGDGRYSPRYLSGVALTNRPDHASQPGISHSLTGHAGQLYVIHSATPLTHTHNNMPDTDPDKDPAKDPTNTNNGDPAKDPTKCNNTDPAKDPTNVTETAPDKDPANTHSEDDGWMDIANQIASLLGLGEEASGDDIVAAVKSLQEDYNILKESGSTTNTNSAKRPSPRLLHSQGARRMDARVQPPADKVMHTSTGQDYKVTQPAMDKVAHCRKAVADKAVQLGRDLDASEFNSVWLRAAREFDDKAVS